MAQKDEFEHNEVPHIYGPPSGEVRRTWRPGRRRPDIDVQGGRAIGRA